MEGGVYVCVCLCGGGCVAGVLKEWSGRMYKKYKHFILILWDTGFIMFHGKNQNVCALGFIDPHNNN